MDQETKESTELFADSGCVNRGENGILRNSDDGFVLDRVVVLSSGEALIEGRECEVTGARSDELGPSERVVNQGTGEGTSGDSSNLADGIVLEKVVVMSCGELNCDFGSGNRHLGSNGGVRIEETDGRRGTDEAFHQVENKTGTNSGNSVNRVARGTAIVVNSEENASCRIEESEGLQGKSNDLRSSELVENKSKEKVAKADKAMCAIDIECGGRRGKESWDGESICRICHLSSEGPLETTAVAAVGVATTSLDLIQLGCGCKDELGIAHAHCAEAWFKLKGNRICEICGETAKNITGIWDNRFMEEWNDRRFTSTNGSLSSDGGGGCWRGQPFCNFLTACLVIAFMLPWFLRVDLF